MIEHSFSLIPFLTSNTPNISITGNISLQNNLVVVHYSLEGKTENVLFPSISPNPTRRDELWKSTCFEFFLAIKNRPEYWEFNISPSGDWNAYHMTGYRRVNFKEEMLIQKLPLEVQREAGVFHLRVLADLNPILQPGQFLELGITAVIQTRDGNETYWALIHPTTVADFHLRESFTFELSEQTHLAQQSALDG